jgi:hypothetical protein
VKSAIEQIKEQLLRSCVHFRGVQHPTCAAGISMLSVRDTEQPGPYRWPCLRIVGRSEATTVCATRRMYTEQEAQTEAERTEALVRAAEKGPR